MSNQIKFQEFKEYATFLLGNPGLLKELSENYFEQLRSGDLPMLRFLFRLPPLQALSFIQENLQRFLNNSLKDNVLELTVASLKKWSDHFSRSQQREKVKYDVLRVYGIQKQALIHFLNQYTQDLLILGCVVGELEEFQRLLEESVFATEAFPDEEVEGAFLPVEDLRGLKKSQTAADKHQQLVQTIQELERKNLDLQRINNDYKSFVYMASHDLRTPVSNLETLLQLVKETFIERANAEEVRTLQMTELATGRLKRTLEDLLEVIKVEKRANGLILGGGEVQFHEVLQEVKDDIHSLIVKNHALLIEELKVAGIVYPKANLRSIIYNLLSNAVKYGASDRPLLIEVTTFLQDDYVVLSVKDNGLGLTLDQLKNLFSMFNRIHDHVEGLGVGLYSIKRMVESSGGKIDVKSEESKGSEFLVYLPNRRESIDNCL